jgi:hypothetical protein
VERPHRQLRARLADRLRRDDADGLADLDHLARREHAAVAEAADAALRLARENRPDLDALDAGLLDSRGQLLGDLVADADDLLLGQRIEDLLLADAADDAVAQRLERVAALHDRRDRDAVGGAAVLEDDDDVLGHVDEAARQVAGVGRLERRVGETLAGAVRRDEVLQHERPSRKFAVMGVSMTSPEGLDISPRMPASWRTCSLEPRAPESAMM